jgi:GH24 family phage-related lysozyme (muramidase)
LSGKKEKIKTKVKIVLTEEQLDLVNAKINYIQILDEMVFSLSLLSEEEEREPDMVWDFTTAKDQIQKASRWVKTKEDAIEFLKTVRDKIKELPTNTKLKIMEYVIMALMGVVGVKLIYRVLNPRLETVQQIEKKAIDDINQQEPKYQRIRKSTEDLFNHLKWEEGSIYDKGEPALRAYNLGDGAYTIGYGHAIFKGEKEGYDFLPNYEDIKPGVTRITKAQSETLLKDDIKIAEGIINGILNDWEEEGIKPDLTQGMYNTLVSMAYNMGPGIKTKDFLESIKKGDFKTARELILQTSSSLFDDFPGLKARREKEAKMFS